MASQHDSVEQGRLVGFSYSRPIRVITAILFLLVFVLPASIEAKATKGRRKKGTSASAASAKARKHQAARRSVKVGAKKGATKAAPKKPSPVGKPVQSIAVTPAGVLEAAAEPQPFMKAALVSTGASPAPLPIRNPIPDADWDYAQSTPRVPVLLANDPAAPGPLRRALERPYTENPILLAQAPAAQPVKPAPAVAAPQSAPAGGNVTIIAAPQQPPTSNKKSPGVLTIGLIAGGQLRDLFQAQSGPGGFLENASGRFVFGPTIQWHWNRFSIGVDALYRKYGLKSSGTLLGMAFTNQSQGRTWEFPVILRRKFYPQSVNFRPFLGAGLAMRFVGQSSILSAIDRSATDQSQTRQYTFGIPLAAGMEFRYQRFRFVPELRYTLWTGDSSTAIRTQLFDPNYNLVQLLMSVTF
ncbi:MAG: hypothetical protein IT168_14995 [Bryobacterales bacterium]|nr:hypothetical protein [Bryobacterales bacterium]